MTDRLVQLYAEMSEHTKNECENNCRMPHSCCDRMYCDLATVRAREQGVTLTPTGHPTLPYMGPEGCVVAPYLRPLCTLHTCAINGIGFKPGDPKWTKQYFRIRRDIEKLEAEEDGWDTRTDL